MLKRHLSIQSFLSAVLILLGSCVGIANAQNLTVGESLSEAGVPFLRQPLGKTIDLLSDQSPQLSRNVLSMALQSVRCAYRKRLVQSQRSEHLAVIDYSLPSTQKRFWLFDLSRSLLVLRDYVAHGKNSGDDFAKVFSNEVGSLQSSLGLFLAAAAYTGKHGLSLRLHGLEEDFNDRAFDRALVVHGADYVNEAFIARHGRLGRSWGCPALSFHNVPEVVKRLEAGGLLFAYGNDRDWLAHSRMLGC